VVTLGRRGSTSFYSSTFSGASSTTKTGPVDLGTRVAAANARKGGGFRARIASGAALLQSSPLADRIAANLRVASLLSRAPRHKQPALVELSDLASLSSDGLAPVGKAV
jgi:hypothetical protein